jgi:hypothetical protein
MMLPDHILVEVSDDLAGRGDCGEQLLAGAAALLFLVEDRLAKLDALTADVDVAWALNERPDVAVALATERTEGVLLGRPAGAPPTESADIFP